MKKDKDLKYQLELYKRVFNAMPDPVVIKDWEGNFVLANEAVANLYNTTPEQMVGKDDGFFTGNKEQADFFRENVRAIMSSGQTEVVYEDSTDAKTGKVRHFQSFKIPCKNAIGEPQILVIARDITDVATAKNQSENLAKQLTYALEATNDGMWDWNIETQSVSHNQRWYEIVGIDPKNSENSFNEFQELIHPNDQARVKRAIQAAIKDKKKYEVKFRILHKDGKIHWAKDRGQIVEWDSNGKPKRMVGAVSDITEQMSAHKKIEELAYYDPLTELPNRRLLADRIEMTQHKNHENGCHSAILFIDLDHFKILNDTHGHQIGDLLLIEVASRLTHNVSEIDTVARFGGDEFIVVLSELSKNLLTASNEAFTIAERLRNILNQPYHLQLNNLKEEVFKYFISASIGIITFDHQDTQEDILKLSDLALYRAKSQGRNASVVFDPLMQQEVDKNGELIKAIRQAIDNDEFELYYQPQYNQYHQLVGLESLIRWNHPGKGFIPPDQFIPLAEDTSLILPLGKWVINQACQQIMLWSKNELLSKVPVSVNISAKQIWQKDSIDVISSIIEKHSVPSHNLKIEITESVLLESSEKTITKLNQLANKGLKISLDDFGTGFSSLSYLKNMPISEIKIDKSFIRDIEIDSSDAVMVKTITDLGKNFEIDVIAEGVEKKGQLQILKEFGCHIYQGYYFAKPMPASEIEAMLKGQ
ncbi:EAL domain-containing protein [Thiomicrorhabdus indica]|uniref:sensor domain-containing protein n=1 Tax=Thiomicrorhabdus indica TaxID=2267253 RepID=UPI002AA91CFF|nr:EAL domain-containing protein [Thiomicrorhabdus indica]